MRYHRASWSWRCPASPQRPWRRPCARLRGDPLPPPTRRSVEVSSSPSPRSRRAGSNRQPHLITNFNQLAQIRTSVSANRLFCGYFRSSLTPPCLVDSGSFQSGCSKRAGIRFPALSTYPQKIALLQGVCKWAMLGSNQRPPPCKLGRGFPTTLCPVREFRLSERFYGILVRSESGCVRLCTAPVAARLQHALAGRIRLGLR
jgi:hypothetical protein